MRVTDVRFINCPFAFYTRFAVRLVEGICQRSGCKKVRCEYHINYDYRESDSVKSADYKEVCGDTDDHKV